MNVFDTSSGTVVYGARVDGSAPHGRREARVSKNRKEDDVREQEPRSGRAPARACQCGRFDSLLVAPRVGAGRIDVRDRKYGAGIAVRGE